jgi:hypothetical protein
MKKNEILNTKIHQLFLLVLAALFASNGTAVADYELPGPEKKCGCPDGEWNHNTCTGGTGLSEVCGGKCYNVFLNNTSDELGPAGLTEKSNTSSLNNPSGQDPIADCEIALAPFCGCEGDQVCALRYGFADSCAKALCYKKPKDLPDGKDPWEHAKELCNKKTYSGPSEHQYNSWLSCVREYVMSGGVVAGPVHCG